MLKEIYAKVDRGDLLDKEEAVELLGIQNQSGDFYGLLSKANELSRREYANRGYVFAQIGLDSQPCSGGCKFCSLAKQNFVVGSSSEKSEDVILKEAEEIISQNVDALFLMTTADYPQAKFLKTAGKVKALMPANMEFVANIGDFCDSVATQLKQAGFTSAYHIVRLREGTDTSLPKERRIRTLDAIVKAGLSLYYCIEPIGPEHTYEEIADEMLRARNYHVDVMAVMRRVGVPGTAFAGCRDVSELEMTKIAAVTRLVTRPGKSMNVHEPMKMPLLAGVNQLYAEVGVNPRDNNPDTENGRGLDVAAVAHMLSEAEYVVKC